MDFSKVKPQAPRPEADREDDGLQFVVSYVEDRYRPPSTTTFSGSFLSIGIAICVLLSAIPLGSNRPLPWAMWAIVFAMVGAVYVLKRPRSSYAPRAMKAVGVALCIGCVPPLFALLQTIPFGSEAISLNPPATLLAALRYCSYIILFLLTLDICIGGAYVHRMARILFAGVVLHAAWAMVALRFLGDVYPWGEKSAYLGWATGTFINRNSFATFLGMGLVLGVALLLDRSGGRRRTRRLTFMELRPSIALYGLGIVLIAMTLLATGSRMGFLAAMLAVLVVVVLSGPEQGGGSGHGIWRILGVLVIGSVGFVGLGGATGERFLLSQSDAETRLALFEQTRVMIAASPLTGVGMDNFQLGFPAVHTAPVPTAKVWDLAHNTYLALWAELGVVAGTMPILAVFLVAVMLTSARLFGRARGPAPVAAIGVIVLGAVHSTVDFSLEITANVFLFVVIIAMGVSRVRPAHTGAQSQGDQR